MNDKIIPGGELVYQKLSKVMESVFTGQARADGDASNLPPGVRPYGETRSKAQSNLLANLPPAVRQTDRKKRGAQNDTLINDSYENILDEYSPFIIISMLVNHKLGCPLCVTNFKLLKIYTYISYIYYMHDF